MIFIAHAGRVISDVLALEVDEEADNGDTSLSGVAVAKAPPQGQQQTYSSETRTLRRTLTVRDAGGHRIVAMVENVSPANKDRPRSIDDFVDKALFALKNQCHLLVIDLFMPTKHDLQGLPWDIRANFDEAMPRPPRGKRRSLAAFVADRRPKAYWEWLTVGDPLTDMPLFLDVDNYVIAPLDHAY